MAVFLNLVLTEGGQELMAKMVAGAGNIAFTKICTSSAAYREEQLQSLASLESVEQTEAVAKVTRTNGVSVKAEAAFTNTELTVGYYMRTIGLYAADPDIGEILYAVTIETSGNCYMPPYNGVAVSNAHVQLYATVGNAEHVSLEVQQGVYALATDLKEHNADPAAHAVMWAAFAGMIEPIFRQVFAKLPEASARDSTAMTAEEVILAAETEWDGTESPDPTAMTSTEIKEATETEWDGTESPDPTAMTPAEILAAIS